MPKLPVVSGRDTVPALERLGFVVARQRGSHIVMRRGSSGCVVPDHRELKVVTLSGVLKQAEVSADEFLAGIDGLTLAFSPLASLAAAEVGVSAQTFITLSKSN